MQFKNTLQKTEYFGTFSFIMAENKTAKLKEAGAHFAHVKSRRHPSMRKFILGTKNKTDIIDPEKIAELLDGAKGAMETLAKDGQTVLFVGGKGEVARLVEKYAASISMPYVATRWLGGTLTNFDEIKKRIKRLADLEDSSESGKLTKLERLLQNREADRLKKRLSGITSMEKLPGALFIVDTKHEHIAAREAKVKGIPVIGILGSDCDLHDATYPVVANDTSVSSVKYILEEITSAYKEGRDGK